ncbi:MAG TPA: KilA-N domain-containing protein, partial [Fibrobacteria bacterium]|nr:KilA-N domain-containing protein [Fibrobacteria bacterium]
SVLSPETGLKRAVPPVVSRTACLAVAFAYAQHLGLEVAGDESVPMLNPAPAPAPAKHAKFMIGSAAVSVNKDGLISLTDLWKVGGEKKHQHPSRWTKNEENVRFIDEVAKKLNSPLEGMLKSTSGRYSGGTFAHWQVALAYAKWLSPALHMQVNEIYARYKAGDATLAEEVIEKVENPEDLERIERRARAKRQYKRLSSVVFNNGGGQGTARTALELRPGQQMTHSPGSRAERRQIGRI